MYSTREKQPSVPGCVEEPPLRLPLEGGEEQDSVPAARDTKRSPGGGRPVRPRGARRGPVGLWRVVSGWFIANSFMPAWVPRPLRVPGVVYGVTFLIQMLAVTGDVVLSHMFPAFGFRGLFVVLGVLLVALNVGAGPSVFATVLGVLLVDLFVLPPHFAPTLAHDANLTGLLLLLLVGGATSVIASQTERARRSAQDLADSLAGERASLDAVIEAVPDVLSIHEASGAIVRLNRAGQRLIGGRAEVEARDEVARIYGLRAVDGTSFTPADFPVHRALRGELVSCVETLYTDPDGRERHFSVSVAPFRAASGKVAGAVSIAHDITELRRAERAAAARAAELEATFEALADAMTIYDSAGRMVRLNARARALFGSQSVPDFEALPLERRIRLFVPRDEQGNALPLDRWPVVRLLRGEVLTGENVADVVISALDGRTVEVTISGAPVVDATGRITGGVAVFHDVTERRRLERRAQDALNALLEMAEALVAVPEDSAPPAGDPPGVTRSDEYGAVSPVAHRLAVLTRSVLGCQRVSVTSFDSETRLQRPVAQVGLSPAQERLWREKPDLPQVPLDDPSYQDLMARFRAGEVIELDYTRPPLHGLPNPYEIRSMLAAPMHVGGRFVGALSLDYGGAEHAYTPDEIALAAAVARLAALVIERERLLRERASAQAHALALAQANRRMDEFLGVASHELRTPLTTIKANVQLMQRRLSRLPDDAAARNVAEQLATMDTVLERTERQVDRLNRLVGDLLDVSRIQAGRLDMRPESCDLAVIVREAVHEQHMAWPGRTISLAASGRSVPILADADRIGQVVTNFLTNALKYSAEDAPVEVSLRVERRVARVVVRDRGPGLPSEEQRLIWERFHRAPGIEVRSGSGVGLGLGLYISKTIIERHQGQVGVESVPGDGAAFWFTLSTARP